MSSGAPEIPPRSYQTIGRNNGGRDPHHDISAPLAQNQSNNNRSQPFQSIFTPPSGHNQQQPAPMIPPRPGSRAPDNVYPSTQAPLAPPPPPPPLPSHPPNQGGS